MSASTSALQQKNAKHLIQSFSDLSYIKNPESTHIISRADGVYIYSVKGVGYNPANTFQKSGTITIFR